MGSQCRGRPSVGLGGSRIWPLVALLGVGGNGHFYSFVRHSRTEGSRYHNRQDNATSQVYTIKVALIFDGPHQP